MRIAEGLTGSLINWPPRGILVFALLDEDSRDPQLAHRKLLSLRLMLAGPSDSELDPSRLVAFEKAMQMPLLLPTHHLSIRGVLSDVLGKLYVNANIRFEADACRLIRELVESGMGYAVMPLPYFRKECARGTMRYAPNVKPALSLPVILSYRTGSRSAHNRVESIVMTAISRIAQELCGS